MPHREILCSVLGDIISIAMVGSFMFYLVIHSIFEFMSCLASYLLSPLESKKAHRVIIIIDFNVCYFVFVELWT